VSALLQVELVTKGLVQREAKLRKTTTDMWEQAAAARQELACFRALAANEVRTNARGALSLHCLICSTSLWAAV